MRQHFNRIKTLDKNIRKTFCDMTPTKAKQAGRKVALREDWETVKLDIMLECVRQKFYQNPDLRDLLISTGNSLIVENTTGWRDNTWGHDFKTKTLGKNWLGLCLMTVRAEFTGNSYVEINGTDKIIINTETLSTYATLEGPGLWLSQMYDWLYNNGLYIG